MKECYILPIDFFLTDFFCIIILTVLFVKVWFNSIFTRTKSKFLKELEAKRLISKLTGIEVPILNGLPALNPLF